MRIKKTEPYLDFCDVLISPQRSSLDSRNVVNLFRKYKFPYCSTPLTGVGLIASNMDTTGTFEMAYNLARLNCFTCLQKHYTVDHLISFYKDISYDISKQIFYTVGANEDDLKKLKSIRDSLFTYTIFPTLICLDAANGYTTNFVKVLRHLREQYTDSIIMAGNVATSNMTNELIANGADIVKIGIGSGSVCETRTVTGVGIPQLSAIDECAFEAHGLRGHICSDGGITSIGDICKAFCAGADFVMLGGLLAGSNECDGDWEDNEFSGKKYLRFHGMASKEAHIKWYKEADGKYTPEGKEVLVEAKGPVEDIIRNIYGGLASCCTYIGCSEIKDMPKCAEFVKVNRTHNTVFS